MSGSAGSGRPSGLPASQWVHRLEVVDAAFAEAQAVQGDALPCRRGCSSCCAVVFDIHPADAAHLGAWLDDPDRPPGERESVLSRARSVVEEVREAARRLASAGPQDPGAEDASDWSPEDGFATLPSSTITRLAGAVTSACPILDPGDGACLAHASRPAICRLQGLPWQDPATGELLEDHCRIDPRQAALRPGRLDLSALRATRVDASLEARVATGEERLGPHRTFVAEALVRWSH